MARRRLSSDAAEIADLPPVLYVRGTLEPADDGGVTVVGTRRPTAYGKKVAAHLAGDLAKAGVTVVSGLARGIDGIAHHASLDAGGRTVAVLGSGVDVIYPPEHANLVGEIVKHGALLHEFPLGTKPEARHFPRRNRLLSGLSLGTLVIEAGEGSGTLSTVKYALEQDREVFCVPGTHLLTREHPDQPAPPRGRETRPASGRCSGGVAPRDIAGHPRSIARDARRADRGRSGADRGVGFRAAPRGRLEPQHRSTRDASRRGAGCHGDAGTGAAGR